MIHCSALQFCQHARDTLPLPSVLPTLTWYNAAALSSANTHVIHCLCLQFCQHSRDILPLPRSYASIHAIHRPYPVVLPTLTRYTVSALQFCQHSRDNCLCYAVLPELTWYTAPATQFCQQSRDTLPLHCSSANTHKVVDSQLISPVISWVLTSYIND